MVRRLSCSAVCDIATLTLCPLELQFAPRTRNFCAKHTLGHSNKHPWSGSTWFSYQMMKQQHETTGWPKSCDVDC